MADSLTHVMTARVSGLWICEPYERVLFLVGVILPDIVEKSMVLIAQRPIYFATSTHSIVGIMLCSYLLSFGFEEALRRRVFCLLTVGSILHVCVDLLKHNFAIMSEFPLFPFWNEGVQWGLFYPENIVYALPVDLMLIFLSELFYRSRGKKIL